MLAWVVLVEVGERRRRRRLPWWYAHLLDDGSGEAYGTDKYDSVEDFERAMEAALREDEEQ